MKLKSIPLATIRVAGVATLLVVSALGAADVNDDRRPDVLTVSKLGAVIFLNQPQKSSATVFPGKDWEIATPESQGVDSAKLNEAVALLDHTIGSNGVHELVIVRNGRMIWHGDDIDKVHGIWSFTKVFTSTSLGLLIDNGKCTLDTKAKDILPSMAAVYPEVTLRHFATMTSGYRAVGDEHGSYKHGASETPFAPNPAPLFTPPGSHFAYWDSAMNQFANVLTHIAGEPLEELFKRRIADPIGMNRAKWDWGDWGPVDGTLVNGGSGNKGGPMKISARETARLGLLFLNRGNWNGKQLISERWVDEATRVQVPATVPHGFAERAGSGPGEYGFNWWVNGIKPDGQRKFPGAPPNTYCGAGHNNNFCFVIPEWNMVITRLGLDGSAKDKVLSDFLAKAGAAILTAAPSVALPSIDTSGFADSAHHWRHIRSTDRFIQVLPGQKSYAPAQVREIAANILLFQRENGGWPKDYDMTAVLTEEQKAAVRATRNHADTSFDNGNLHSQVTYLARAYTEAGEPEWRDACLSGFDFMLAAQYPNGGFPQRYPNPKDFHAHITFNDYVMIGILNVLQDAAEGRPHFAWLDAARRDRARDAVRRGVECILKCQIREDGKLTGWCQQHDEKTFEARPARGFELASICPQDTTHSIRFLMRLDSPSTEVVRATDAAVEWLHQAKLTGVRVKRVKAPPAKFEKHDADFDMVVVKSAKAPPVWARHYEIGSNRPIFADYDAVKRYSLAEISRERRTGTPWYGEWPQALLERDYLQWRAKVRATKATASTTTGR